MDFLLEWGYLGLFIGSFLASTIIPFSSEFLLIGMLLAGGNPWVCLALSTIGNTLGSYTCYGLGYLGKWEWIEKWLRIKREKLEKQQQVILKWSSLVALLCWLPVVGDVFSVGLGFYKIPFWKMAILMFIGKALRFLFWIGLWFLMPEKLLKP
ncbi:MAG TPA: YqaA family protein [Bacteroidales bacterium]|jgi:membrane protein YqaA with SNARE-associated domain|nr:Inner membrane protein YqaA [Bacteroidales bacterium]MCZ2416321.1 DedA family protein [Burkholderiales bacterium]OQC57214.1 MAG: Inner membrane protein YqaA [Bacteroidetes bacterium ADurb.Bin013]MCZ2317593.1 DedA family protein [Bacteroidales bacterium]HNR28432.1 YqaA family protein [Bacteroidales bacterium]